EKSCEAWHFPFGFRFGTGVVANVRPGVGGDYPQVKPWKMQDTTGLVCNITRPLRNPAARHIELLLESGVQIRCLNEYSIRSPDGSRNFVPSSRMWSACTPAAQRSTITATSETSEPLCWLIFCAASCGRVDTSSTT